MHEYIPQIYIDIRGVTILQILDSITFSILDFYFFFFFFLSTGCYAILPPLFTMYHTVKFKTFITNLSERGGGLSSVSGSPASAVAIVARVASPLSRTGR